MSADPFNVREYWVQLGEPEPQRTPVRGGFRHQRFHVGDVVQVPEPALAGFPPPGVYIVAGVACDPVDAPYPGSGVWSARYTLEGCDVPAYDETLRRVSESEQWLFRNPEALAAVRQGLKESAEGRSTV